MKQRVENYISDSINSITFSIEAFLVDHPDLHIVNTSLTTIVKSGCFIEYCALVVFEEK